MRQLILSLMILGFCLAGKAQMNPVQWSYSAKKLDNKTYEVHMTVNVQSPWHIYSQTTPDGGPLPTKIAFTKNPLLQLNGKAKEVGKMLQKHEEVFGVDVRYYDGKVDFIQEVKLKSSAKTKLSGTIEYMVCNDEQCLPPVKMPFSVQLN